MNNSVEMFGCKIKALRENSGLTQSNIANFLKVDLSFLSMVEKGERALTSDMIEKLEALFFIEFNTFQESDLNTNPLHFTLCTSEITEEDLEVIALVNRIALNSHYMTKLLKNPN